jgi:hypothetical protein
MLAHSYERTDLVRNRPTELVEIHVLRERLRKMPDSDLLLFGVTTKYLGSRSTDSEQTPDGAVPVELTEARTEWKRRFPRLPLSISF